MGALLAVGSTALDTIETPTTRRAEILGGSVPFVVVGGSFFTTVRAVSPLGTDFPVEHLQLLRKFGVDTDGMTIHDGLSFRWTGRYHENMNDRDTLETQLNVLGDFDARIPDTYRDTPYIFLANGTPEVQMRVLDQCPQAKLVVADTMNLWINIACDVLDRVLKRIDGLLLNDSEAVLLTGDTNLIRSGRKILSMGPKFVIIKKGEHGSLFFSDLSTFAIPAIPTEEVVDPTGAGDSFGGGLMGYLASQEFQLTGRNFSENDLVTLRRAIAYGTVVSSYTIEGFSLDAFMGVTRTDIDRRFENLRATLQF